MRPFSVMYVKVYQRELVSLFRRITCYMCGDVSPDAHVAVSSSLRKFPIIICLFAYRMLCNRVSFFDWLLEARTFRDDFNVDLWLKWSPTHSCLI